MAPRQPKIETAEERFLAPLKKIAARDPEIEVFVFWAEGGLYPDLPSEALESEEIAFWLEGLIAEGFALSWQLIGEGEAAHIRLYASDVAAEPPSSAAVIAAGKWPA